VPTAVPAKAAAVVPVADVQPQSMLPVDEATRTEATGEFGVR